MILSVALELRAVQEEVLPEHRAALSHAIEGLTSAVASLSRTPAWAGPIWPAAPGCSA